MLYPVVDPLSFNAPWYYHNMGNHIVYNDQWFDCKTFAVALTMELYPRRRKYLEGHMGWFYPHKG